MQRGAKYSECDGTTEASHPSRVDQGRRPLLSKASTRSSAGRAGASALREACRILGRIDAARAGLVDDPHHSHLEA